MYMIPKIIHRIWLGSDLPQEYVQYGKTFEAFHGDFEMKLWTEKELKEDGLWRDDIPGYYNCQSNVYRLMILQKYGGTYVDCDIECVASLRMFQTQLGYCGYQVEKHTISNAVIASIPNGAWINKLVATLPKYMSMKPPYGPKHITENTKLATLTDPGDGIMVMPKDFFFPYSFYQTRCSPKDCTYLVHKWDRRWMGH